MLSTLTSETIQTVFIQYRPAPTPVGPRKETFFSTGSYIKQSNSLNGNHKKKAVWFINWLIKQQTRSILNFILTNSWCYANIHSLANSHWILSELDPKNRPNWRFNNNPEAEANFIEIFNCCNISNKFTKDIVIKALKEVNDS